MKPEDADNRALRQRVAELEDLVQAQRADLEVEGRLATLGELARPLTHEFNNFLNVLLLQLVVMEADLPENLRDDMGEIRRQGHAVTGLIRQFQRYRQAPAEELSADLGRVLRDALDALGCSLDKAADTGRLTIRSGQGPEQVAVPLQLHLADGLPRVAGSPPELRRLCFFLLQNAAAAAAGRVTVRTEVAGGKVVVRFEDDGPALEEEQLSQPFDPGHPARERTNALEMVACRGIARRIHGSLSAENLPEGGVAIVLELSPV